MKIGVIGCGNISSIYLNNLTKHFLNTEVYALCDLDEQKAKAQAEKFGVSRILTLEQMLSDPAIGLILNITTPQTHYSLCKKILLAGKHAYVEKPLSLTYAQGKELVELAESKGLYLGCAPDTFLGAGIQTAMDAIERGLIGTPHSGAAYMMCPGHESWHPSPAFYYDLGGGPLFDMGPYYLTALVRLLGRVKSVFAVGQKAFTERTITSQPLCGTKMPVKVDTHNTGILCFENGATVTLVTSFDVIKHSMPCIELYGTEGSLKVPDPNGFDGPVRLATRENREYTELPLVSGYTQNRRGMGISDMIAAIEEKREGNASGRLALHVLEIMEAMTQSAQTGTPILLESSPSPYVPLDWSVEPYQLKTKE